MESTPVYIAITLRGNVTIKHYFFQRKPFERKWIAPGVSTMVKKQRLRYNDYEISSLLAKLVELTFDKRFRLIEFY